MRPLVVRGERTMIIDAGLGDKEDATFSDIYGVDRAMHLDRSLADAGLSPEDIDIVLATHLHFDHAGGFTTRDASGRIRPRFPRARYIVRQASGTMRRTLTNGIAPATGRTTTCRWPKRASWIWWTTIGRSCRVFVSAARAVITCIIRWSG